MQPTTSSLVRWSGLALIAAGVIFASIQPIHPLDILASVTTSKWVIIQSLKLSMCFLGLLGITGLYARQVEESGWLGLAGYLLFGFFYAMTSAFVFAEAYILPHLATEAPKFVEGFLGIINGAASEVNLGVLPTLYAVTGLGYVFGGVLLGIGTFRAHILPRWAAVLLAAGAVLPMVLNMLPHPLNRTFAIPMGIALAWLGYALWSERRGQAANTLPVTAGSQLIPTSVK